VGPPAMCRRIAMSGPVVTGSEAAALPGVPLPVALVGLANRGGCLDVLTAREPCPLERCVAALAAGFAAALEPAVGAAPAGTVISRSGSRPARACSRAMYRSYLHATNGSILRVSPTLDHTPRRLPKTAGGATKAPSFDALSPPFSGFSPRE